MNLENIENLDFENITEMYDDILFFGEKMASCSCYASDGSYFGPCFGLADLYGTACSSWCRAKGAKLNTSFRSYVHSSGAYSLCDVCTKYGYVHFCSCDGC